MRARTRTAAAVAASILALAAAPAAARAQAAVTLSVRPAVPAYGAAVTMSGSVAPPAAVPVSVTLGGRSFAAGRSRADGTFSLQAVARRPGPLVATASGAASPAVELRIRPRLHARISGVRILGAPLTLTGTLTPAAAGTLRATTGSQTRALPVGAGGAFRLRVPSRRVGRVCVRLSLSPAPGFAAVTARRCARVGTPALTLGARGDGVRFLQDRLARLHYALLSGRGRFGADTRDAVYAFQKAERLARDGVAGPAVWRRLLSAHTPAAAGPGTYLEVDKTRQLLFEVRGGRVRLAAHVSTGATGNTPVGRWRIYAKTPGTNARGMYDSMYFLRGFAVHGYATVPPWPASHGCVRVPMWLAPLLYARWPVGSSVLVLP